MRLADEQRPVTDHARRRRQRAGSAGRLAPSRPTRSSAATPSTCTSGPTPRSCGRRATCPVRAFEAAHQGVGSSLHPGADSDEPDPGAFIYAAQRLPSCIAAVERVVMAQLPEQISSVVEGDIAQWHAGLGAGSPTAVVLGWRRDAGRLDRLDLRPGRRDPDPGGVPDRVEQAAPPDRVPAGRGALVWRARRRPTTPTWSVWASGCSCLPEDWGGCGRSGAASYGPSLQAMAAAPERHAGADARWHPRRVRAAGGSLVAADRHATSLSTGCWSGPLYFVSSNPHSIVNLLSGYVRRRAETLWRFLEATRDGAAAAEIEALRRARELQQSGERALLRRPALARQPRRCVDEGARAPPRRPSAASRRSRRPAAST